MRKLLLLSTLLVAVNLGNAQTTSEQQTINEQVWKPFIRAYNTMDANAFMAVHTPDVWRILRDNENILVGEAYRRNVQENMAQARQRGVQRQIELRFTERFAKNGFAFETGYYKVVARYSDTEQYTFYGRFHVTLRRENGRWKISMDSDTSRTEKGEITEPEFARAQPMEKG